MTKLQFNIKLVITVLLLISTTKSIAQCGFGGTSSGLTVTPSLTTQTTAAIGAGDYFLMNVQTGGIYTVSTCTNGTFDTQLSLYNESGGAFIAYNDDFCGLRSTVSFVATFTGQVRVLLNRYNCSTTNGGNADFGVEYFGTVDSDGDGVFDDTDLDDDNDGILDTDEQSCANVTIPASNAASAATSTLAHNIGFSIGSDDNRAYIDADNESFIVDFGQLVSTGTNITIEANASNTAAIMVIEESYDGITFSNATNYAFASTNTDVIYNYTINSTARYIQISSINLPLTFTRRIRVDNVAFASFVRLDCVSRDTDGDGIPDALDLDADNDGIYDVVESGALDLAGVNDADNDGVIDIGAGSFGANGLYSGIETNDTGGATLTFTNSDSDTDGTIDAFELDSDNDGCDDAIEAGYTDGDNNGLLGSGTFGAGLTVDANGVVTSGTDGYTTPDDNDTSGTYDFQQVLDIVITGQPSDETICINDDGSISVTATGSDLSYQWQISTGGAFSDLSNAGVYSDVTTDELVITGATGTMDGYQYQVVISSSANVCSTVTSNAVTLTMQDEPEAGTNGALDLCVGETATLAQLNTAITGEDSGGTWSPALASGVTTYTYTVNATAPCTGNDTSTVTVSYQAQPDAGTNGTLTVCEGTSPTNAQLFAQLGGSPDAGGAWTNSGLVYTYTVTATAPCTGNDTATVTVTEQAEPDAGTNGTLDLCAGETATLAQLNAAITGEDSGGTWSPALASGVTSYTYTVNATAPCTGNDTSTVAVTITALEDASFSYDSGDYCTDESDPTPTITGVAGGTFSSTGGLVINASTGEIDVSASTVGNYTITYTTSGTCPGSDTASVEIAEPLAVYCQRYRVRNSANVWGPWINFTGGSCTIPLCDDGGFQDIQFDAGPFTATGWVWTDEDGNVDSEVDERVVFLNIGTDDAGTYNGVYTSPAGCVSNISFDVVVTEQPDAGNNGTLDLCEGETATLAQLNAAITGEDAGGTWSPALATGVTTYTYTVAATSPCTGNDTSTVTVTYQAQPDAGTNGTLTVCIGTTPTDAELFAELGGTPDAGGTWSNVGLVYTYTVAATAPCTGNDTATVTLTEQAEPDAGTNGTLTVCIGTTPTDAELFAELGGTPDVGGTWSNVGLVYTYTVAATAPCTGNDTATVTLTEQAEPDAGTNGTLTVCIGTTPTDAELFAELGGTPDVGGTWSNVGLVYTYTVNATLPCTGNDTATVTLTEQAEPDAGTNGTLTVCIGTTPTDAELFAELGGTPDAGGTWSNVGLVYTYTVAATAPCTGNDTATVTLTEQAEPDAGTNGTLTVCIGTTPTDAELFAELGGTPDVGGTWSNVGLVYTYTVNATLPCTGNDTATVTLTEQAEPDAGTNGTLTVCIGTTPTDAELFAELGGTPDAGGTWSNVGLVYTYTVAATAPCTGNDTATVTLTEQAEPDAGTNGTLTVCIGTTPTDAELFAELGGTPDVGGTWSNVGLVYTYTVAATAPCTGNDTATVTLTEQAEPDAGTNGTLTVCIGTTPTDAELFAELGGTPDVGGTWSNVGLVYTYTVAATAPCTGNDTATVTLTEQAEPDAGTNGTLTVCIGTTPTDAELFAELGGTPDVGGTWSNVGLVYTYTVAATAPCTGNDTATVTLTEQAEPDAGTNGTLTVCIGTTPTDAELFAELGGTPDVGGTWSNVGLVYTYTVAATAPCTGNDTATVTLTEQAEPDAGTNGTLTVCIGTTPTDAELFAELGGTPDAGGTWSNVGLVYTYTVAATAPCTGNDTATVTLTEQAEPDAGTNGTLTVCIGTTPTDAELFAELGGTPDVGGTWSNVGLVYTYTVAATAPCTGNDTATVTLTEQAEPDAGTNGTLTVCIGTTPTDAELFAELGGTPDVGGTWSNVGLVYTYTVNATLPCTGNDTATVTLTEQAEPDAGTNGTLTVCIGTTPTDAELFAELGGTPDAGGTWSNVGLVYTYTVAATAPCTGNDTATVTLTEQAEPDAGTNGTLTVCIGTTPTDAELFAELGGTPDVGGTWSNVGLVYTYTVAATAPCTGNDTATVTLTEQAEPDAGTNGTLTVCIGTTPTDAELFAELGGTPDVGGTWSNVGLVYTYTVAATAPCTGNDTATVTLTEQAEPDAGTNGTLTVCIGTTPTDAELFAELGGTPDVGGTWSNVGLVYTYTVAATAPCTGNDTATVTLTEQAEPDAGTNGTLTVCIGTTPTDAELFAELGGTPDVGGTWSNVGLVYTYTVAATAPCTGNDTATVTLTEQAEPDAGTNGTLTVCIGTTPTDAELFAELGGTPDAGGTWSNVGLVYTYTVAATAPCTGNDTATVTLTEQAEPDAGTNGTLTVCIGTTPTDAELFAELGGTPDVGGTWSNVGLVYTYTVAATAPCTGNDTATVTLTEQAEPDAGTNGTLTVCIGTTPTDAELFAELGGTPDVGGTWSNVGLVYTYTVNATLPCTGNDTATVTLTEQAEPDAGTNGTLTVCIGTTPTDAELFAELGGTPDAGGTWSNVGLVYTYTVAATAPCTGNDTATVTLTEQAEPDAGTNGTLTVCIGTTPTDAELFAELGGTPDVGGTWSNVGLVYTYTVNATLPCTGNDTATVTLTEQAEPDAGTNGTLTVCIGTTPTDAELFAELGGTPDAGGTWSNVGLVYTYTVAATAPCTGNDTATVTLTEQAEPDAGTNGTLTVCIGTTPTDAELFAELGGTPDVGGTWSNVGLVYTYTVAATAHVQEMIQLR